MRIREIIWSPEVLDKVQRKHGLSFEEVEEACFGTEAKIRRARDRRHAVYGRTKSGRYVFVVMFMVGGGRIRIVTARDMNAADKDLYKRHF